MTIANMTKTTAARLATMNATWLIGRKAACNASGKNIKINMKRSILPRCRSANDISLQPGLIWRVRQQAAKSSAYLIGGSFDYEKDVCEGNLPQGPKQIGIGSARGTHPEVDGERDAEDDADPEEDAREVAIHAVGDD